MTTAATERLFLELEKWCMLMFFIHFNTNTGPKKTKQKRAVETARIHSYTSTTRTFYLSHWCEMHFSLKCDFYALVSVRVESGLCGIQGCVLIGSCDTCTVHSALISSHDVQAFIGNCLHPLFGEWALKFYFKDVMYVDGIETLFEAGVNMEIWP